MSSSCSPRPILIAILMLLFAPLAVRSQVPDPVIAAQAPQPGSEHSYIGLGAETVNPADGQVTFDLPIHTPAGRQLGFPFGIRYSHAEGYHLSNQNTNQFIWTANGTSGTSSVDGWSYELPYLTAATFANVWVTYSGYPLQPDTHQCDYATNFVFLGFDGRQHTLQLAGGQWNDPSYQGVNPNDCLSAPYDAGTTSNTHGILATYPSNYSGWPLYPPVTVVDPSGTTYLFSTWGGGNAGHVSPASPSQALSLAQTITDRNGNQIALNGNSYKDTLGRTVVSWTGLGNQSGDQVTVSGYSSNIVLHWGPAGGGGYPMSGHVLSGNSTCTVPTTGPPTGQSGVTEIDLPNGHSYKLTYDSTYGTISTIQFPDGGTVRYTWGLNHSGAATYGQWWFANDGYQAQQSCSVAYDVPAVTDRWLNDGQKDVLHQQFSYTTNWSSSPWKQTTVTTHDLVTGLTSVTVYTYGEAWPDTTPYTPVCSYCAVPAEVETVQQDGSGHTLKTLYQEWMDYISVDGSQTILDSGQGTATIRCFDKNEQLTDLYEYGFQSEGSYPGNPTPQSGTTCGTEAGFNTSALGPLRRHTLTAYHNFVGASPSTHIVDEPDYVTVYDGSNNQVKQTSFVYDGSIVVGSGAQTGLVTPPGLRGNATTVTRWLNSGGTSPTTTYTYYDTGNVATMVDACNSGCSDMTGSNHTTTYNYTDNFSSGTPPAQTNAYLYQVTNPKLATVTYSWGYNDGLLRSRSDQNSQVTNYIYNTPSSTCSFPDGLDRLSEVDSPDGGKTTYCYNDSSYNTSTPSPSITSSKLITGSTYLTTLTAFDGLGHTVRSVLTSDPDCATGGRTDTTYDGFGHVYTVSNPYCNSNDLTNGLTTYSYDALGRTIKVISPDGSASASAYSGNSTVVRDQAGNERRSYTDSLGRLQEVDEPGPGFVGSGTPGTGSVTITGSEQSTSVNECPGNGTPCWYTVYDTGTVTVMVNGVTAGTGSYGGGDTPSSVATSVAYAINHNSSSPVSASANGAAVNLTAKSSGSVTNYSLYASSATTYTQYFSYPSFYTSISGSTLTGGTDFTFGGGIYTTLYAYDLLDNLICAVQRGTDTTAFTTCAAASATWRPRSFSYDSLSRLLTSNNPETGSISYSYDANGNLASKTSLLPNQTGTTPVAASYTYDVLNRLTQKSFNDSYTPTVKYGYDGVALSCTPGPPSLSDSYPIGRRTAMCDGAGAESWSHDPMGRTLTDLRTTNGLTKSTIYTYAPYVDGSLNKLTYPSTRTVTYTPTGAERLFSAVDASGPINYALGAKYIASGALTSLQNGGSLYSTFLYNNRLQPCWMYSTNTSSGAPTNCTQSGVANGAILDYQYNFGIGMNDNGNVYQIANRRDPTRAQNFTYDALNRLATAQTQTSGVTIPNANCWGLTFGYDPWGNLLSGSTTGPTGCSEPLPLNVSVSNVNRIVSNTVAGQVSNYCYDAPGNLIFITASGASCPTSGPYQYAYDAENHLTSTAGVNYSYDGDGKRVMKSNGKLYWYGTSSDPLDETDASGNLTDEYIFFNGKRIARRDSSNNVDYYFADHLGTARVVTNAGGTILDDIDFYPFGGERSVVGPSSLNTYLFTGKERDQESGLDNFGARYDASSLGRFMSSDPVAGSAWNPQSLNAYSYVWNNPLKLTDPSGMIVSWEDSECKKHGSEAACMTDLQRKYEKRIQDLLNSKDKKEQARGKALEATYQKLQDAKETFHVVREGGDGSGELSYRGHPGDLYVEMKGSGSLYGEMPDLQKLGHEFEHGEQFLNGLLGFALNPKSGKWEGYRDDLVDEANAFMAGFMAEPVGNDQTKFLQGLGQAANWGVNEVVKKLDAPGSPYRGRATEEIPITTITPSIYAVPRTQ
jgi:RHS repeat-associated protein